MSWAGVKEKKVLTGQVAIRGEDGRLTGALGLTEQQYALVIAFATTGNVSGAAEIVGCSADTASHTLRLDHVQAALHSECQAMLASAAPIAIACLTHIIEDKDAPVRVRLDASKAILDRTGHGLSKDREGRQGGKRDLSDLSLAELAAFIQQGQERQRQAGAVDAEGTITAPLLGPP